MLCARLESVVTGGDGDEVEDCSAAGAVSSDCDAAFSADAVSSAVMDNVVATEVSLNLMSFSSRI